MPVIMQAPYAAAVPCFRRLIRQSSLSSDAAPALCSADQLFLLFISARMTERMTQLVAKPTPSLFRGLL